MCVGDGYPFWGYCWILYRGMTVCPSSCLQPRYAHYLNNRFVRSDQISVALSSVPAQIVFMPSISFTCAESVTTGAWTKDSPLLFGSCPACGCPSGESHLTGCKRVVDRCYCSVVISAYWINSHWRIIRSLLAQGLRVVRLHGPHEGDYPVHNQSRRTSWNAEVN